MSIKDTAANIIRQAKKAVGEELGDEYTGFDMHIGTWNIELKTYSHSIEIKRWSQGEFNHHFYSVFTNGRWYSGGISEKQKMILRIGLKHAFQYLSEYAKFKKQNGFVIVKEKDNDSGRDVSEYALELLNEMDKTEFSQEERENAATVFNYYAEKYLASNMTDELKHYIKNAYKSAVALEKVVKENPLCIIGVYPMSLMKGSISFQYHGETIFIRIAKDGVEVRCQDLDSRMDFPFPLERDNLIEVLNMVEDANKVKNLINPTPFYFNRFVNKALSIYENESIDREFGEIAAYFDSEWTRVEVLFKDAVSELEDGKKGQLIDLVAHYKETNAQTSIQLNRIEIGIYTFWIAVYENVGPNYNDHFKVFITENQEVSDEAKAFVMQYLNKTLELKF